MYSTFKYYVEINWNNALVFMFIQIQNILNKSHFICIGSYYLYEM